MTNFNGDVLTNTDLHVTALQSGSGTDQPPIATSSTAESNASELTTKPAQLAGTQDGYGQPRLTALAAAGINPIPHYKLSCEDNTGTRHYWVDVSISLYYAPPGFTYVPSTFVVEGRF